MVDNKDTKQLNPDDTDANVKPDDSEASKPPTDDANTKPDDDGDDTLSPKAQAILEKRIERELRKQRAQYEAEVKAEKERLAKEAREQKLLEEKNFEALAKQREEELSQLKADLETRTLNEKTDVLLDKAEITSPELRSLIKGLPGDLEKRSQHIDGIATVIEAQVESKVAERLRTKPPNKDNGQPSKRRLHDMTMAERTEERQKIGDEAYAARWRKEKSAAS